MKPTRNIVKPSPFWKPKGNVWFKHNDDAKLARELREDMEGQELFVPEFENVVGFHKGKIVDGGKVVGRINKSNVKKIMEARAMDEWGTTDIKKIMKMEGFE